VRSKDELVLLMIDAAIGEDELPEPPPRGWRAGLELSSRMQWSFYQRHPWLAPAMSINRPQPAPNGMAHTEWALRALDGLGLDPATMLNVHLTTFNYVRGTAVNLESEAEAEADTGITKEQWFEDQDSTFGAILASGRFPLLTHFATDPGIDIDVNLDTLFEFGLRRVLDGIAVLIAERTAGH
jgi:hypothetical protein